MSASTGTIQRPVAPGSIVGAVVIGVATGVAVATLAWAALNATSTRQAATPVVSPISIEERRVMEAAPMAVSPRVDRAITTFDIDTAHAVPYVDRFAPTP